MKKNIIIYTLSILVMVIITTSCNEKSKKDNIDLKEDVHVIDEDIKEFTAELVSDIELSIMNNWTDFKIRSENAILNTDKELENIKLELIKAVTKDKIILSQELDLVEQKSNLLKEKLVKQKAKFDNNLIIFNKEAMEKQLSFEREFDHDMEELETAIQNVLKNNVK